MATTKAIAHIDNNNVLIELLDSFGVKTIKTIDLMNFIQICRKMPNTISTPILPLGTLKYTESGNSCTLVVFSPEDRFTANLANGNPAIQNALRPNIIAQIKMNKSNGNKWRLAKVKMFGTMESPIMFTDATKLNHLPFPNIDHDGAICWGVANIMGEIPSLSSVGLLIDKFFSSPFNDHLYSSKVGQFGSYEILFKKLAELESWKKEFFSTHYNEIPTLGSL